MDFTRIPLLETILTAREGYVLHLHNCWREEEHYTAAALQLVTIGGVLFYRAAEDPCLFLLPANAYRVTESKQPSLGLVYSKEQRRPRKGNTRKRRRQSTNDKEQPTEEKSSGGGTVDTGDLKSPGT